MLADACVDSASLWSARAAALVCYPSWSTGCALRRLALLELLGVEAICGWGRTRVPVPGSEVPVLGKGHASLVVLARARWGLAALKIRRTDSKRESLHGEAELLLSASRAGASPRPYAWSHDAILMEYVAGPTLGEALARGSCRLRIALEALMAARALDSTRILHRELSRAQGHVIFTGDPCSSRALIVDLESASRGKCGNVPKLVSYLLRSTGVAPGPRLRGLLRRYKSEGCPRSLYEEILEEVVAALTR